MVVAMLCYAFATLEVPSDSHSLPIVAGIAEALLSEVNAPAD